MKVESTFNEFDERFPLAFSSSTMMRTDMAEVAKSGHRKLGHRKLGHRKLEHQKHKNTYEFQADANFLVATECVLAASHAHAKSGFTSQRKHRNKIRVLESENVVGSGQQSTPTSGTALTLNITYLLGRHRG